MFAHLVRAQLQSIAYGHVGATRSERIIAGFLLNEIFQAPNFRLIRTDG